MSGYFTPVADASNHSCSSQATARWSGNFLNHILTHTIDPMKIAMAGGYRSVDTVSQTILDKGWSSRSYYRDLGLGAKIITGTDVISGATPFSTNKLSVVANNYGNKFHIYSGDDYWTANHANDAVPAAADDDSPATYYEYFGRAEVCVSGMLEDNCEQYPNGNFKPVGVIQKNERDLRFAAFGYLNEDDYERDGGVLRARMASLGPTYKSGRSVLTNPNPEWNENTGVFIDNPQPDDASDSGVSNSGVINYLNQFGKSSDRYKLYDPVSELYYTVLRYLRNKGNVPEYTNNLNEVNKDGFPVITDWDDPVQYSCQKSYVIGIGDTNTHGDFDLPGYVFNPVDHHALPALVASDAATGSLSDNTGVIPHLMNVTESTNRVGDLEGGENVGLAGLKANQENTQASYYMAGLAYDVRTRDFRPDIDGEQTIRTYWLDVLEDGGDYVDSSPGERRNQFWLTAKFGGFNVPEDFGDPYSGGLTQLEDSWWDEDADGEPDNYYPADNPRKMIDGLEAALESLLADANRPSSALKAESPFVYTSDVVISSSYDASSWIGEVKGTIITGFESSGRPIFEQVWLASEKIASQNWNSGRNIVTQSCNAAGSNCQGVPFRWDQLSYDHAGNDQKDALGDSAAEQQKVLDFIRGDDSNEEGGGLRNRTSLLGDIVNSKVVVVGAPASPYADTYNPGYSAFRLDNKSRTPVAYVCANDGMMHAFEATDDSSTGGREIFAYVPSAVFEGPDEDPETSGLAALAKTNFIHHAYVDAEPVAVDIDFDTDEDDADWRTVLFGGLGKGGRSVYAIDVTDPDDFATESGAAQNVLWEFSHADLGFTFGKPIVVRVDIDSSSYPDFSGWAVIIGSGYNNTDGKGYFFVLDAISGDLIAKVPLPGSFWTSGTDAGLAHVNAYIPSFAEYVADAAYAGDLDGNLWRLNLTDLTVTRLGQLEDADGNAQPVTTPPMIEPSYTEDKRYVVVATGKLLHENDLPNSQTHTIYSFVDGSKTRQEDYSEKDIDRSMLADVSSSYASDGGSTAYGWFIDLADQYRVVTDPVSGNGFVVLVANKPASDMCQMDTTSNGSSRLFALSLSEGYSLFSQPYEQFDSLAKEINIYRSPNSNGPRINVTTEEGDEEASSSMKSALAPEVRLINWRNIINYDD